MTQQAVDVELEGMAEAMVDLRKHSARRGRTVPPELMPTVLMLHTARYRWHRVRHARGGAAGGGAGGERGAISTELALAIIALVALSVVVLAAISRLGSRTAGKVDGL
jgi:hypothetical protein